MKEWNAKYQDQGLVIIANHFPEFDYEQDLIELQKAVIDQGIEYAVAQDNDGSTWKSYGNIYWPTLYLIDKRGHIRYSHIGEGGYSGTEDAIIQLLNEPFTN